MPLYFFHLANDYEIEDSEGTDLPDVQSARRHARSVVGELTRNSDGLLGKQWASWTMLVKDANGRRILSIPLSQDPSSDGGAGNGKDRSADVR